jgi:hypothetical protein
MQETSPIRYPAEESDRCNVTARRRVRRDGSDPMPQPSGGGGRTLDRPVHVSTMASYFEFHDGNALRPEGVLWTGLGCVNTPRSHWYWPSGLMNLELLAEPENIQSYSDNATQLPFWGLNIKYVWKLSAILSDFESNGVAR